MQGRVNGDASTMRARTCSITGRASTVVVRRRQMRRGEASNRPLVGGHAGGLASGNSLGIGSHFCCPEVEQ